MLNVSKFGIRPDKTLGRVYETENDKFRNNYQRDVGRIIHSTAFRRLKYKTHSYIQHPLTHSLV